MGGKKAITTVAKERLHVTAFLVAGRADDPRNAPPVIS